MCYFMRISAASTLRGGRNEKESKDHPFSWVKGHIVKGHDGFYHIQIEAVRPTRSVDYFDPDKQKFKTPEEAVKEHFALIGNKWEFGGIEVSFYQEIEIDIPTVKT